MDSDSVIFKVFLKTDESFETRKFVVDDVSVITSFLYIKGKLAMVFPKLNNVPFKITWKDIDGDDITIDNDEDLVMAFTEMSGPLKVLYVTVSQPHQEHQYRMYNAYCDACNKVIVGYRYKCLQCPDFDLCADCEHAGHHKEHYMLRSSNGELPFSGMCKRISENINKSIKKAQSMAHKEAHRNAKYSKKYEKKCEHPPKFKCDTEIPASFYEMPSSVMKLINAVLSGYTENYSNQNQNQQQEPQTSQQSQPHTSQQSQQSQQQTSQQEQQSDGGHQQQQQPAFVDMMMKALSNIFPEAQTTQASQPDYPMNATTPTPTGSNKPPQVGPFSGSACGQTSSPMEEDIDLKNPIPKSQSWTIINHDTVQNTPREVPQIPQVPQVSQVPQIPQVPQASAPISPQDQKILDGLKQLKDMGFTDHPDLITLLKRYDGQVGSVIKHIFDNNDII